MRTRSSPGDTATRQKYISTLYVHQKKSVKEIATILRISNELVMYYLKKENIKVDKQVTYWTDEEIDIVTKYYANTPICDLKKMLPTRSLGMIRHRAYKLRIKKEYIYPIQTPRSTLEVLLSENLESFYWMGFLAADGWTTHNVTLGVGISVKDETHLLKYKNYIKYTKDLARSTSSPTKLVEVYSNQVKLVARDKDIVPKIIEKFDFKYNKTFNPPSKLKYIDFTQDQLISFFIGFIDGDGTINTEYCKLVSGERGKGSPRISIECIYAWKEFLDFLIETIESKFNCKLPRGYKRVRKNKSDLVVTRINTINIINKLKDFALENNLPVLERKWDKVTL